MKTIISMLLFVTVVAARTSIISRSAEGDVNTQYLKKRSAEPQGIGCRHDAPWCKRKRSAEDDVITKYLEKRSAGPQGGVGCHHNAPWCKRSAEEYVKSSYLKKRSAEPQSKPGKPGVGCTIHGGGPWCNVKRSAGDDLITQYLS